MTNAKFYRNLVCAGLGALALGYVPLSHAFYAQATPPAGFVAGAVNTYNAAKAGVTASVELGRIAANASLSVGGKTVAIATKLPLAANAAKVIAAAIYLHPGVRTVVTVASWIGLAGYTYDLVDGWMQPDPNVPVSDGYTYRGYDAIGSDLSSASCEAAADVVMSGLSARSNYFSYERTGPCVGSWSYYNQYQTATTFPFKEISKQTGSVATGNKIVLRSASSCPIGWYSTPAGCVISAPPVKISQEDFVEGLTKKDMPAAVPSAVPVDIPVLVPYIEPVFIPTGAPVKNPNYDPSKPQTGENQPYVQPGVKIDPANDAKNPFQVNVQPSNRPTSSPNGSTESQPITPGSGTETDGSNDQPKEDKDERDLCEKNPDILACQKVDTEVEDAEIPKSQKTVSYQAENIWGGGSCPADQYARVGGQQLKVVDWSRDCQFITDYVRPVTLVICALIVAGILAGALKP